jgi:hypothetical protein
VSWHNARLAVAVETQEGCAHQEPRQAESSVVSPVLPLDAALEASAAAWRCHCCQGTRRWRSIYGAVVCARCHPPASPALVTGWAGEASPIARWPALSCIGAAQSADTATSWASDASQQRERGRADAGGSQVQRLVGHSCGKWSVP